MSVRRGGGLGGQEKIVGLRAELDRDMQFEPKRGRFGPA